MSVRFILRKPRRRTVTFASEVVTLWSVSC